MVRRIVRHRDETRTALLDQAELFVEKGKGGNNYYCAWLKEPDVLKCPICGGEVIKIQDLFSKSYRELIANDKSESVITLEYDFHKYRCLNENCHHIFAKDICFASKYDNVTYRLENRIAELVMDGLSYSDISNRFQNSITRQAVGQIFNRWVRKKEDARTTPVFPSSIAVLSGKTDKDYYTIILGLDDGIRIFDILFGVDSLNVSAVINHISSNIKTVLSDFNSTISEVIKDNLPNATYIIPVDYWFELVTDDYSEYAHEILKWSPIRRKDDLVLQTEAELAHRISDLMLLFESRPKIVPAYEQYNKLRDIISRRDEMWVYDELTDWAENLEPDFKEQLSATLFQLQIYKPELEAHVQHRELVPDRLYSLTSRLEELISGMRTFSDEILKARVLYSTDTDLHDWRGVPIEEAIAALEKMRRNGEDYYEYE